MLRALLIQLLPLDEPRRIEGQVALAFLSYAAVRPGIATRLRESSAGIDPADAATALLVLVDGLGVQVLTRHYSAEVALAAFDAHLDAVFGSA
jgi:hypothetical protein